MADLRQRLVDIVMAQRPMTVRQAFYQAVVHGLVEKDEGEYKSTIARLLLDMRRSGEIPHSWIVDNTRWMRKPRTYRGLADFIEAHQRTYRRSLWEGSETYIEVWCEKEALAGVLLDVTSEFDVPLMVSRGFASESYLYAAADKITDELSEHGSAAQAVIYHLGDFDPSGVHAASAIEAGLRRLCGELLSGFTSDHLAFERVAVTEEQISTFGLPTRPTKRAGNAHANSWPDGRPSVELDAIPPETLRWLARDCIERHLDPDRLAELRVVEDAEREQLQLWAQALSPAPAP
jgi:hypothetical protein